MARQLPRRTYLSLSFAYWNIKNSADLGGVFLSTSGKISLRAARSLPARRSAGSPGRAALRRRGARAASLTFRFLGTVSEQPAGKAAALHFDVVLHLLNAGT